jgi:hypothetical protein
MMDSIPSRVTGLIAWSWYSRARKLLGGGSTVKTATYIGTADHRLIPGELIDRSEDMRFTRGVPEDVSESAAVSLEEMDDFLVGSRAPQKSKVPSPPEEPDTVLAPQGQSEE